MAMTSEHQLLSAHEAAFVTGVPLKTVRRIVDAGLLRDFAEKHDGKRMIFKRALVGLKLAHETANILSLESRRRLVRHVLEDPDAGTVREEAVSVDVRPMKNDVKRRIASLEKAKKIIAGDKDILGGAPCFKGTRIPAHFIAAMRANGEQVASILGAYPDLTEEQVGAAAIYAEAYPCRDFRHKRPAKWKIKPRISKTEKLDTLLRVS